jgi:hypothetical protein
MATDFRGEQSPEGGRAPHPPRTVTYLRESGHGPTRDDAARAQRGKREYGNVKEAKGTERCHGSSEGKSSEGQNPRSATGMKDARMARGGENRQEGEKP